MNSNGISQNSKNNGGMDPKNPFKIDRTRREERRAGPEPCGTCAADPDRRVHATARHVAPALVGSGANCARLKPGMGGFSGTPRATVPSACFPIFFIHKVLNEVYLQIYFI